MTACSDVEAVVLVGGQGTRLRPLTLSAAKPMLPTAGVPFLAHQLSRLRAIGIRRVALGTSYRASTFSDHFGDGSALGMNIAYVVEDAPLGTGGAIRNVLDRLTAPTILVLNGDILSGVDLQALLDQHRSRQADVTLHLVRVPDARAFGCVLTDPDGRVRSFVEKSDTPATDQINAGCYVFRRDIIQTIPADTVVSVERETFPGLVGSGARVFGHVDTTYWLDLGTPAAFVQGSADLVRGLAPTSALPGPVGDSLRLEGAMVAVGSAVTGGTTLGRGVRVGADATVDGSVIFDGARIGDGARVIRSAVGHHAVIGRNVVLIDAVIGDGAVIGDNCELPADARVWPGVTVPAGSTRPRSRCDPDPDDANRRPMKQPRLIAFDLDDTLAPSKSRMDPVMADLLGALLDLVPVCIISGGRFEQFSAQVLTSLPATSHLSNLHLMPTCGTQYYERSGAGWSRMYSEDLTDDEKARVVDALVDGVRTLGLDQVATWGPTIEDRGSQVTFSALGQDAPVEAKKKWDPSGAKKESLRAYVAARVPDLEVRSGGSTSVDVTRKGVDKSYGMNRIKERLDLADADILFIGDRLDEGGNDYPVKAMGIQCIAVKEWHDTAEVVRGLIAQLSATGGSADRIGASALSPTPS